MNRIRRYGLSVALVLTSIFAVPLAISFSSDIFESKIANIIIDFEEGSESSENQKTESEAKEFKLTFLSAISLKRQFLSNCQKYGQLDVQHSMDVLLPILTPPPEAS